MARSWCATEDAVVGVAAYFDMQLTVTGGAVLPMPA